MMSGRCSQTSRVTHQVYQLGQVKQVLCYCPLIGCCELREVTVRPRDLLREEPGTWSQILLVFFSSTTFPLPVPL